MTIENISMAVASSELVFPGPVNTISGAENPVLSAAFNSPVELISAPHPN